MLNKLRATLVALAVLGGPVVVTTAIAPPAAACQNRTYFQYYVLITGQFRPATYAAYLQARAMGIWTYKNSYTVCY